MIFMVASGVFNSWLALDTNWLRVWFSDSNWSLMELKASASWRISPLPLTCARTPRSPLDMLLITRVMSLMGCVSTRENTIPAMTAASATPTKRSTMLFCKNSRLFIISFTEEMSKSTPMTWEDSTILAVE